MRARKAINGSTMLDGRTLVVALIPPTTNMKIKTQTVRDLRSENDIVILVTNKGT